MGNVIQSFFSGVIHAVGNVLEAPLDFLSGKSCRPTCGSTWDFICYIEHFCVANLLKLVAVLFLFYLVLVFIYLLFKAGVFGCLGGAAGKMLRAFCSASASCCERGVVSLRRAMRRRKMNKSMAMEGEEEERDEEYRVGIFSGSRESVYRQKESTSFSSSLSWERERRRRRAHLERSLKARSHRIRVELTERSCRKGEWRGCEVSGHGVRVVRASKFVRKPRGIGGGQRGRRW
ncbi:uncharacterized protein LOC144716174 [Wolffia australiana]